MEPPAALAARCRTPNSMSIASLRDARLRRRSTGDGSATGPITRAPEAA